MKSEHKQEGDKYNASIIEAKWRKKWEEEGLYSPNLDKAAKPFYNLMMFPYPSAEGLHVGSVFTFTGADTFARFKRMQGYDVFEPMGLDGFGIHSENYALKVGKHPKEQAQISEKNFYRQLSSIGNGYDWSRKLETYDPAYYTWTQWIFIQLFKRGLAYRKKAPVNFCPSCKTVLADEQVIENKCERCSSIVEKRELEQWFFKITDYAERLLKNIEGLNWTEKVKIAQRDWIGKKEGINITYKVVNSNKKIVCFTTTPVNYAATFIVLSPEHPLVLELTTKEHIEEVKLYIKKAKSVRDVERMAQGRKKTGVFTGSYAINHVTGGQIPIWVSDFVLMNVGTGAVQGCPGHDMRDFEFAKKFGLPIKRVVVGPDGDTSPIERPEQVIQAGESGKMVNSEFLNGSNYAEAMQKTMDYFEKKGWGERVTTYHLRDWLISRQRYWGPPIPMIYCQKCDWQPVPEDQLPVLLPDVEDWRPEGSGTSPLANHPEFYKTTCPSCGGEAKRETDVSDTFLDSAWYFFRYLSTDIESTAFDIKRAKKWLPVTIYIGGAEHSVLHLLYSRFITMVFKDMGLIDFEEPYARFYAHGLIIKDGAKMSKSKGNVINPDEYLKKYGADTLRAYLRFVGPFDKGGDFRDSGIEGMHKFLQRVWKLLNRLDFQESMSEQETKTMHKTIQGVTEDMEALRFNTAVAKLMTYYNFLSKKSGISKQEAETYIKLLAPVAPFLAEELFQRLRPENSKFPSARVQGEGEIRNSKIQSVHASAWPAVDKKYLVEDEVTIVVQVDGKVRDTFRIQNAESRIQNAMEKKARESGKVKQYLSGKNIAKVIYIEGKIINFVTE